MELKRIIQLLTLIIIVGHFNSRDISNNEKQELNTVYFPTESKRIDALTGKSSAR